LLVIEGGGISTDDWTGKLKYLDGIYLVMQHYFPFIFTYNSKCLVESDLEEINLLSIYTGIFEA
jgi:hypothetical protein